jgi:NAD(P)H dehydrogenase (quinone)
MNIGIIVYSQTGNTLKAAENVKDALAAKGHKVSIEQVTTEGKVSPNTPVSLKSKPDAAKYDALVFASPVMAFSLNPVMKAYLPQIKELKGKKAACFVVQGLPFNGMGGKQALKQMCGLLTSKGAQVVGTGVVFRGKKQADETAAALCGVS